MVGRRPDSTVSRSSSRASIATLLGASLAVFLAGVLLMSGCLNRAVAPHPADDAQAPSASTEGITGFSPSEKQSQIATSFPPEVPVVKGVVMYAQAYGNTQWDYSVDVAAPSDAVAQWYREAFAGRGWSTVSDTSAPDTNGALVYNLEMAKGLAVTRVHVARVGRGARIAAQLAFNLPTGGQQ